MRNSLKLAVIFAILCSNCSSKDGEGQRAARQTAPVAPEATAADTQEGSLPTADSSIISGSPTKTEDGKAAIALPETPAAAATVPDSDLLVVGKKHSLRGSYELSINGDTRKFPGFDERAIFKNVCTDGETTISVEIKRDGSVYKPSMAGCILGATKIPAEVMLGLDVRCAADSIHNADEAIALFSCNKGKLQVKDLKIDATVVNFNKWD